MSALFPFHGGLKTVRHKIESNQGSILAGPLPRQLTVPLRQHIGRPARPTVKEGDAVEEGECVADLPPGEMGAPIHASIAGRVTRVTDAAVTIAASTRRKG